MIIPDVNLLLYAVVDGFPEHAAAHRWWLAALNDTEPVGLCPPVVFGFVRIVTNRRIIDPPMAVDAAIAQVNAWLARPHVLLLAAGERSVTIALNLLEHVGTAANLTNDAQIAAHALEHRAVVQSNDSDFERFPGLRWINPLLAR